MYNEHFRLREEPFSIAPDPSFLYRSQSHLEALAHLHYGFSHGGFVMITGEVGTGKTTLLRNLVTETPDDLDVAFILNPRLTVKELLETVCDELSIQLSGPANQSVKFYIDALNRHLLEVHRQGRSTVLIIDEAQNLSPAVLEQIRLLTNLETNERKLLRIILIGQPELEELMARQDLRQLAQRITARYRLQPLDAAETSAYVAHRLTKAGGDPSLFTPDALTVLYKQTSGIPRLVNVIADRAMLGAFSLNQTQVTAEVTRLAAAEVLGIEPTTDRRWIWGAAAAGVLLIGALLAYLLLPFDDAPSSSVAQPSGEAMTTTAPVVVDASELAQLQPPSTGNSDRAAYAHLFQSWGLALALPDEPCRAAERDGFECASGSGSWEQLLRLDLPVVLELWDSDREPYFAALLGAHADYLTVGVGDETLHIDPAALKDQWFGNFTYIWPTPARYNGPLAEGDKHPTVVELRGRLEQALSRPLPTVEPDYFDQSMADALAEFQRREQLTVDRVAGVNTWALLARYGWREVPRLSDS